MSKPISMEGLESALAGDSVDINEEVVLCVGMKVKPDKQSRKGFEQALKSLLRAVNKAPGHLCSCVIRPRDGEEKYTSIIKYKDRKYLDALNDNLTSIGIDMYKLLATRDSYLTEPPTFQIESGFGSWVDANGDTKPMTDSDSVPVNPHYDCDSCDDPKGLIVKASFVLPKHSKTVFRDKYQRNNKKGGQKNLRCFPACRNGSHVTSGFCGESIRVHVVISRKTVSGGIIVCPIRASSPNLLAYCRFIPLGGNQDSKITGPILSPGCVIKYSTIEPFVKTRANPLLPMLKGHFKGSASQGEMSSSLFEFNGECKAWHYGWSAPRGQGHSGGDIHHIVEVLFFKPVGEMLHCLEIIRSSKFSIFSSRRANQAANAQKRRSESISPAVTTTFKVEKPSVDPQVSSPVGSFPPATPSTDSLLAEIATSLAQTPPPAVPTDIHAATIPHLQKKQRNNVNSPSNVQSVTVSTDEIPWPDLYDMFDDTKNAPLSNTSVPENQNFCVLPIK